MAKDTQEKWVSATIKVVHPEYGYGYTRAFRRSDGAVAVMFESGITGFSFKEFALQCEMEGECV